MMMLIMNAEDADLIRKAGRGTLNPRLIEAGKYAGEFALPSRVLKDPDHEDVLGALIDLPQIEIDIETAWPLKEE